MPKRNTLKTACAHAAIVLLGALIPATDALANPCAGGAFSGLSVGIDAGLARTNGDGSFSHPALTFPGSSGLAPNDSVFGSAWGGRLGYHLQCQSLVMGIEADYGMTRLDARQHHYDPFNTASGGFRDNQLVVTSSLDHFATIRGRLGLTLAPGWLVYGTAGWAQGKVDHALHWTYQGVGANNISTASAGGSRSGWVAGGGLEYALGKGWTVRGEALHVELGDSETTFRIPPVFGAAATVQSARWEDSFWLARVGLTYRILP